MRNTSNVQNYLVFIAFATLIITAGCKRERPINYLEFSDEGTCILGSWYMIGPFEYDTTLQKPDETFFNDDLGLFGIEESSFKIGDVQRLIHDENVKVGYVSEKLVVNKLPSVIDSVHLKSNVYLVTTVYCEEEQDVYMMVDGAASYRIWVNGKMTYTERFKRNSGNQCERFIKIGLKAGENLFLAKVNRESNMVAWGLNIALAKDEKAKEIFRSNHIRSFVLNPIFEDTVYLYPGPLDIEKIEIVGHEKVASFESVPVSETVSMLCCTSEFSSGFFEINLITTDSDTLNQIIFKGNLRDYYVSLTELFEKKNGENANSSTYNALLRRINFFYDNENANNIGESEVKYYSTNLVHWIHRLEVLVKNDLLQYSKRLSLRSFISPDERVYEYAFFLDNDQVIEASVPLIVVIPFGITSDKFSTSWYLGNYEQLFADIELAKKRGFAICYLFANGPSYVPADFIDEFTHILNDINGNFPSVNTDKVYLTGACEGASRALVLANSLPDRISAIGVKTPLPDYYYPDKLSNIKEKPLFIQHGSYDRVVSGKQMNQLVRHLSTQFESVDYFELREGHDSFRKDERRYIFDFFNSVNDSVN